MTDTTTAPAATPAVQPDDAAYVRRYILLSGPLDGQYTTTWGTLHRARREATTRFGNAWSEITSLAIDIDGLTQLVDRRMDIDDARTAARDEHIERGHLTHLPAAELETSQHIWHDDRVREIRYVDLAAAGTRVLVVLDGADVTRFDGRQLVQLATPKQVEAAAQITRALAIADGLTGLSALIQGGQLPVSTYGLDIGITVPAEALTAAAGKLGLSVEESAGALRATWASAEQVDGTPAVQYQLTARPRPVPPGGDRP